MGDIFFAVRAAAQQLDASLCATQAIARNLDIVNRSLICIIYIRGSNAASISFKASLRLIPYELLYETRSLQAQLSQRGRATLRVVEKITTFLFNKLYVLYVNYWSHAKRGCKLLLVFHCNYKYVSILYRFWDIRRRIMACPWNLG